MTVINKCAIGANIYLGSRQFLFNNQEVSELNYIMGSSPMIVYLFGDYELDPSYCSTISTLLYQGGAPSNLVTLSENTLTIWQEGLFDAGTW